MRFFKHIPLGSLLSFACCCNYLLIAQKPIPSAGDSSRHKNEAGQEFYKNQTDIIDIGLLILHRDPLFGTQVWDYAELFPGRYCFL